MRHLTCALFAFAGLALSGCEPECTPEPDLAVVINPDTEQVMALPVLSSGLHNLLDVEVPDTHGDFTVSVGLENAPSVIVDGFTLEQTVNGQPLPVQTLRARLGDGALEAGAELPNLSKLRFQWRAEQLADFQLPEAKAYTSKVTLNWRFAGCRTQSGVAVGTVSGIVKSPDVRKNFALQSVEAGRIDVLRGAKARATVGSTVSNDQVLVQSQRVTVTFFDLGVPPVIGHGIAEAANLARRIGGIPASTVPPSGTVDFFTTSTAAQDSTAQYEHGGRAASTSTLVGAGKAVVRLELTSQRTFGQGTPVTDVLHALVDVP